MFLYLALAASLLGADAKHNQFHKARHARHNVDVDGIAKYAKEHRDSSDRRNLRDMVKPHDLVIEFFRDSACTIPMQKSVMHGNSCHQSYDETDGSVSLAKVGCALGSDGFVKHDYVNYGDADDCSGSPMWGPVQVPFWGIWGGVSPGDCLMMFMDDDEEAEQMYAKVDCSGKDPFRDEMGFHTLQ